MRSLQSVAAKPLLPDIARRRFVTNVASNVGYVVLNTALMVWYIPFLVGHLGVAAFGMISLSNALVAYAGIITTSLDVSINRFLAIDLNRGNEADANRTFNTALALSIAACAILLLPMGGVAYFFPVFFNVPADLEVTTQFLFASVGVTTLAAILGCSFGVASLITHRFDLRNIVRSLTSLSRPGLVALCFIFWPASLWWVAAGFIISALIGLFGDVLVWRLLTPQLHINWRDVDRDKLRDLGSFSGWSTVNQVGFLLLMQIDLLLVNMMFGAAMTGRYGSILLFPVLIDTMTATIVTVLSPAIMARFAVGDIDGIRRIALSSVKLLGIGLALPIGLLCGFSRPLLTLWLGPEFVQLDTLLILLVCHLTINLATRPLAYVLMAFDRVKVQGIVTLALGAANVVIALAFVRWSGWGVAGIAAAAAIVWTIRNAAFLSSYAAVLMDMRWWTFYIPLTAGAVGTVGIALVGRFTCQLWWPASWLTLGLSAALIATAYSFIAYTVSLNTIDRNLLLDLLRVKRQV